MEHPRVFRRRTQLFYGRGDLFVYAGFAVLSLMLMLLPDSQQRLIASHIQDYALYPFRQLALSIEEAGELSRRNRALAERVAGLELELARTRELQRENLRLREMLEISRLSEFQLVGCKVIAEGGGRLGDRTLLLDRGFRHGVQRDMPITGSGGLAGKIVEVYPESARALLLTHRASAVGVRSQRSRVHGIAEWDPASTRRLQLKGIAYLADMAVADTLVTSGIGGIFPPGIPVGTIERIERDVTGFVLDIDVRTAVDFTRLEEVFVLTDEAIVAPAEETAQIPATEGERP